MDSYAIKSPHELLRLYALMYGANRLGDKYVCSYITDILKNKGYKIAIDENMYKLIPIKENVLNKEKKMKNIVIKFENRLLINYVLAELAVALDLTNNTSTDDRHEFQRKFITIKDKTILKTANISPDKDRKEFVITSARNADIIIEEVIKEYNKVETKIFNLKCAYNTTSIPVIVYPDKVSFNNEYLTFDKFIQLRNNLCASVGGYEVGGSNLLLFTHMNTGTKVWISKEDFKPVVDAVLCKL